MTQNNFTTKNALYTLKIFPKNSNINSAFIAKNEASN